MPRVRTAPKDLLDWSDRHVLRATSDNVVLERYKDLVRTITAAALIWIMEASLILVTTIAGLSLIGRVSDSGLPARAWQYGILCSGRDPLGAAATSEGEPPSP
jgi:hypothetical protein